MVDSAPPMKPVRMNMNAVVRRAWRRLRGVNDRTITLPPHGAAPARGRVLLSYIIDGVMARSEAEIPHSHPHFWETWAMAECFRDEGYTVDVIHWTRWKTLPRLDYDIYVDVRRNFDRFSSQLPGACLNIAHMDTAHYRVHNGNQLQRLEALRSRRGITLSPFKLVEENQAAEHADLITVLGNAFTMGTFAYAGKPVVRIRLSNAFECDFPERKDFDAVRRRFLWLGSEGFVHKGLDLVLEAFAARPELELVVCGPIRNEPEFARAFSDLLFRTPNIRTEGWIDICGPKFREITSSCVGMVYPSCSEGGAGCVINAMHAGLIPIVNVEASVDIEPDRGVMLPDCSLETIGEAAINLSRLPADRLRSLSRSAWTWVRANHSRERFRRDYREFVRGLPSCIQRKKEQA